MYDFVSQDCFDRLFIPIATFHHVFLVVMSLILVIFVSFTRLVSPMSYVAN